jgi:8-oxo-dGTP pyrophosphatase MutT (NUDIX family)
MNDYLKNILSSRVKKTLVDKKFKPAAVLVPLFSDGNELQILLTRRSEKVFHHQGQISFPGGQPHKEDPDLLHTALRESWEEIGLKPEDVQIVGELDDTPTITSGFMITPFVGVIPYPYSFNLNLLETTGVFNIPISTLMENSAYREEAVDSNGVVQQAYLFQGNTIWGATARIIKQLLDMIKNEDELNLK